MKRETVFKLVGNKIIEGRALVLNDDELKRLRGIADAGGGSINDLLAYTYEDGGLDGIEHDVASQEVAAAEILSTVARHIHRYDVSETILSADNDGFEEGIAALRSISSAGTLETLIDELRAACLAADGELARRLSDRLASKEGWDRWTKAQEILVAAVKRAGRKKFDYDEVSTEKEFLDYCESCAAEGRRYSDEAASALLAGVAAAMAGDMSKARVGIEQAVALWVAGPAWD
jgi:hypothetical protein